jgi:hypothetical protein
MLVPGLFSAARSFASTKRCTRIADAGSPLRCICLWSQASTDSSSSRLVTVSWHTSTGSVLYPNLYYICFTNLEAIPELYIGTGTSMLYRAWTVLISLHITIKLLNVPIFIFVEAVLCSGSGSDKTVTRWNLQVTHLRREASGRAYRALYTR